MTKLGKLTIWLGIGLHFFLGISALFGGVIGVANPTTPMGLETGMLQLGPFQDFLVPSLYLLLVLGAGNLISAILDMRETRNAQWTFSIMGVLQVSFIFAQMYMMVNAHPLHGIFLLFGLVQFGLGLYVFSRFLVKQN